MFRLYFIRGSATRLLSPYLAIIALQGCLSFTLYIAKIVPLADVPFCCEYRGEMCHFQHTFYRLYYICYICYVGLFDGLCVCVYIWVFGLDIRTNVTNMRVCVLQGYLGVDIVCNVFKIQWGIVRCQRHDPCAFYFIIVGLVGELGGYCNFHIC